MIAENGGSQKEIDEWYKTIGKEEKIKPITNADVKLLEEAIRRTKDMKPTWKDLFGFKTSNFQGNEEKKSSEKEIK